MKTREKQNKHKLKFDYIAQLKMLGKIWKEHCKSVDQSISTIDDKYDNEVVKLMSSSIKKEFCSILDRCDDIATNISNVDESLSCSHEKFREYKKIILEKNDKN